MPTHNSREVKLKGELYILIKCFKHYSVVHPGRIVPDSSQELDIPAQIAGPEDYILIDKRFKCLVMTRDQVLDALREMG